MSNIKIAYTYGRFGSGPGVGGNAACSNHHVLPYYVMEYIGLLWCALARDQAKYSQALTALVTAPTTNNMIAAMGNTPGDYLVAEAAPAFTNFTGAFAWLGDNLFTGPAATYRVVDPSQRTEPEKPTSLPDARWRKLDAVWQQVKDVHLPHETGARRRIEVPDHKATKIIDAAMACFHGAGPHRTVVSDWCAKTSNDARTRYCVDVSVLSSSGVGEARAHDRTFDWCELELVASGEPLASSAYRQIIQVTGGAQGKIASIQKTGSPTEIMGRADFVNAFHV